MGSKGSTSTTPLLENPGSSSRIGTSGSNAGMEIAGKLALNSGAENHRPTGKCVKYTPTSWGLRGLKMGKHYEWMGLQIYSFDMEANKWLHG